MRSRKKQAVIRWICCRRKECSIDWFGLIFFFCRLDDLVTLLTYWMQFLENLKSTKFCCVLLRLGIFHYSRFIVGISFEPCLLILVVHWSASVTRLLHAKTHLRNARSCRVSGRQSPRFHFCSKIPRSVANFASAGYEEAYLERVRFLERQRRLTQLHSGVE